MTYFLRLVATGMVTFRPAAVAYPATVPSLTFVMMDNPTRRKSLNYPNTDIVKHVGFVMTHERNAVFGDSWRPSDFRNRFNYVGWELDKERLSLFGDPAQGVTFNGAPLSEVANVSQHAPGAVMEPQYAELRPPKLDPVAGQFFLQSGSVDVAGKPVKVHFRTSAGAITPEVIIRNEVLVDIPSQSPDVVILSNALGTGASLPSMRLRFPTGAQHMTVYFGSAPPAALQEVPSGTIVLPHTQDVDFELYYDISKGGPPGQRPIPHRGGSGPVPGSERCPPLHNS